MELHLLEVRLLGNYDVRLDGAPVEINSRPARLLLAYLLLMAGTPQPRDKVAGILWLRLSWTGEPVGQARQAGQSAAGM